MKAFTDLFLAIDSTTKTLPKIKVLENYFKQAPANDALWCIALLSGRKPKRNIKTAELKQWAIEFSGIPEWLFLESYSTVGDLAETIALCLPMPKQEKEDNLTLSQTMEALKLLNNYSDIERKEWVFSKWQNLNYEERFVFNKLITGGFRMGVSQQLVIKALAKAFTIDEKIIAHRLMGNWNAETTTLQKLILTENNSDNDARPYPFYLAYALENKAIELGEIGEWQIERKYDGIRGQIIVRNKEIYVWSRGEELITEKFPEFNCLKEILTHGTVLDGEILPYKNNLPLPFHIMQTRISRKNITKKILADAPIALICYDILEHNGIDIRQLPIKERRLLLEKIIEQAQKQTDVLKLSPIVEGKNWEEIEQIQLNSRAFLCEGLMLKHKESIYDIGRKKGNWWKWKVEPLRADGVLLYAQSGHGRRANLYTDYTFAVWHNNELLPFTKAYSGLTDKELIEVDAWIKKNTVEKFGPVRSVKPELVFELAFEGINPSPRHKSGIALRFPRILRWRKDKTIAEANTKDDLLKLIDQLKQ